MLLGLAGFLVSFVTGSVISIITGTFFEPIVSIKKASFRQFLNKFDLLYAVSNTVEELCGII